VGIKKGIKKIVKVGSLVYKITTRKVEEKILPTFDDRLARQVGLGNAEELKNKILSDMKKMEKKRIEDDMKESLANIILERNKFKVPNVLTKFEYEDMLRKEKLPDSDSNKERFWNIAEKRARFNLIIDKIADKEDIKVTKNAALDLIRETDVRLTDENRADLIDYMTTILRREKVLDFLFKNSKITQKSRIISPKEVADANRSVRH
jgi:FKBP-type peptidyl-prolyl cis-trans isomerase (trigger factor)